MYLASVSLRSIRSKTTRSLIVCSSVPKSFFAAATTAKSNEQKRPFWATTPAQKQNEEVKEGDEKVDKNILTTKQLVKLVAETHKLSKAESRRIMDTVFDSIAIAVAKKKSVAIAGFGKFKTRESKAFTARNPRTQEPVSVPAKCRIKFLPSKLFKKTTEGEEEPSV